MKIALSGIGKIARDQHIPALEASEDWELAATISRSGQVEGVEHFTDLGAFLEARPDIEVISFCQPPVPRYALARQALEAGRHVMLEKPPGATLAEVHDLARLAGERGRTLYTTWHSRMAAGVSVAKDWLATREVTGGRIDWIEDVKQWHPGQDWVFEPGGLGVFDPGINALSILTEILPRPVFLTEATLEVPENRQTPIAAQLQFTQGIEARFDWREAGPPTWNMEIETAEGSVKLIRGGSRVEIAGEAVETGPHAEYPALYERMAELVLHGTQDVDLAPMVLVADAMSLGRRESVAAFEW
ncbi:Gfo/Idh/MocA family protein [Wenxinia saemankumensis]|uniref:D-galactose 1-dehydrogenase n=1 Tax=Wenxinia saemankumensis TaxID=1447782 RepID=A0A1M6H1K1_9RHOB|nr:Gfo/Idh/MocA family oxidoreductase [Wenxinia saemankumensis]SHJ16088.1 D-galactose 1-dehydrogenase [Wenxinia saemankumensis]